MNPGLRGSLTVVVLCLTVLGVVGAVFQHDPAPVAPTPTTHVAYAWQPMFQPGVHDGADIRECLGRYLPVRVPYTAGDRDAMFAAERLAFHYTAVVYDGCTGRNFERKPVAPTTTTGPPTTAHITTTNVPNGKCYEDMPCWDCHTMGNRICGKP